MLGPRGRGCASVPMGNGDTHHIYLFALVMQSPKRAPTHREHSRMPAGPCRAADTTCEGCPSQTHECGGSPRVPALPWVLSLQAREGPGNVHF